MTIHAKNLEHAPPIIIDGAHYKRLANMANFYLEQNPYVAERLLEEIERSDILESNKMPSDVVNMRSKVTYLDETTEMQETVILVWPDEADITRKQISIMTPIGAALIGLRKNASLEWQTNNGIIKKLKILRVES